MSQMKRKPVVVTTEHRGVFFGYIPANAKTDVDRITLQQARMCLYWSADVRGVVGLAATGPTKNCRVGPPAPSLSVNKITAVMDASDSAATAWEAGPWA